MTRAQGEPIRSEKARFLQLRLTLAGKAGASPTVEAVAAAYQQRNLPPVVKSITVHPAGEAFQKPISVSGEPEILGLDTDPLSDRAAAQRPPAGSPPAISFSRKLYQRGLRTFSWQAEDPNADALLFDVEYRAVGDERWRPLRAGLEEPVFAWDTATVPNGRYLLRVVASDAPGNPPAFALTGSKASVSFEVDNLPPSIAATLDPARGTASASPCATTRAPCASWRRRSTPAAGRRSTRSDGIADSLEETYEIPLPPAAGRPRIVVLRATDLLGNVATARVDVPVGRSPWTSCSSAPARSGTCSCCGAPWPRCARRDTACASSPPRRPPGPCSGPGPARSRRSSPGTAPRPRRSWRASGPGGRSPPRWMRPTSSSRSRGASPCSRPCAPGRSVSSSTIPRPLRAALTPPFWLAQALEPLALRAGADAPPPLVFSEEERRDARARTRELDDGFLAVHPGSGSPAKNWPAERFAEAARRLSGGRPWLLVLGPAEERPAAWPGAVVAREWPLRVLGAALSRAGLFLGNDSGVAHLAAASGAPTLTLFGPTDPALWAPVGSLGRDAARAGWRPLGPGGRRGRGRGVSLSGRRALERLESRP